MRTTIDIDEYVLKRAKDDARDAGVTLGKLIEGALRRGRDVPAADRVLPKLPTIDGGELLIPIDRMSNAEILDFLDEDLPLDKRR